MVDPEAVQRAVANGVAAFGRLDVVVNNAGQGDWVALEDISLEHFRQQVEVNFLGTVYVTKAVVPILGAGWWSDHPDLVRGWADGDTRDDRLPVREVGHWWFQ